MPALSSASVEFPVHFVESGIAKWIWTARFADKQSSARDGFADSVQSTLSVGHVAPLLREIYLSRTEAVETNLLASANPQLLEGRGVATIRISNTRLSELAEAVSHLLHYPYGCVEQTGSSLLPWIVLRQTPVIGAQIHRSREDMDAVIRDGIKRLLSMQTSDGGLSYWPGGRESMFWGSAYGGMILALARRENLPVSDAAFGRLMKHLTECLRGSGDATSDFSARCLALYALALAKCGESSYHEVLFKQRARLSVENRALLALAILESDGSSAMVDELLTHAGPAPGSDDWFGGGARQIAVRLLAWNRFRPADRAVDTLVAELMQGRKHAHWTTTQGNAWAIFALTDYARRVEGTLNAAQGTLALAGHTESFQFVEKPSVAEKLFPITAETQSKPLVLSNPDRRRLYTQATLEVRAPVAKQPRQDRGYAVHRAYRKLDDDGMPGELREPRVGDRILVTLEIAVHQPAHYVVVDDPLPSLFEAINPEFKSQETGRVSALPGDGEEWNSDFRELRTDRALFFRDHLESGRYVIRYLARVRAAGTATAPATKVEEMYHPERFGLSDTVQVTCRSLD